jgi:streptogramin lyase
MKLIITVVLALSSFNAHAATVITFAGIGTTGFSDDGEPAPHSGLNNVFGVACGPDGPIYFCDMDNDRVRCVKAEGSIETDGGCDIRGRRCDGGPALKAKLAAPKAASVAPNGDVYLAETESHSIRYLDVKRGPLEILIDNGKGDDAPDGVFVDKAGSDFIGDSETHRVRVWRK